VTRTLAAASLLAAAFLVALEGTGRSQLGALPATSTPSRRTGGGKTQSLRSRLGAEVASRLMRSADPDERIRGIERASAIPTREGLALLVRAAASAGAASLDPRLPAEGVARKDPRALLAAVRGLATWSNDESSRAALLSILRDPMTLVTSGGAPTKAASSEEDASRASSPPPPSADPEDAASRVFLARQMAALALAETNSSTALDGLVATARSSGPGQEPAIEALALLPPSSANVLDAAVMTTPALITLAARGGDLRTIDAIVALAHSGDAALRAASIAAIGTDGDARDTGIVRSALADTDPRVRVAAAAALVRLNAPDAAGAVETLINDGATALDGLDLARFVQGEGVTKAAAARAAASADGAIHAAALTALGCQTDPAAVGALQRLVVDPSTGGPAACALAHSPSPSALAALESLAREATLRRLAARAYFVRRYSRGERSAALDALLVALAGSGDARDRAVGLQARVSLGESALAAALDDPDPSVRRAVAMTAVARWSGDVRSAVLARWNMERDAATRTVLAIGLLDGDPFGTITSSALRRLARAGAADAPLAVMALAVRADDNSAHSIDPFLASADPVVRAHAASGLARSSARDAPGRLARFYAWEPNAEVRRAIVAGLAGREDRQATLPRETLEAAAGLDPDRVVRWMARRALARRRPCSGRSVRREVAWIQLVAAPNATLLRDETAMLVQSDGSALPLAFDGDGYALVPGVRSGESRLRLAPRLPAYSLSIP